MSHPADGGQQDLWHLRRTRALALSPSAAAQASREAIAPPAWTQSDLAWERRQEEAALALRAGDRITAARGWIEALEIADRFFARGDPRLASSFASQAVILRQRRRVHQARRMLGYALDAWEDGWRWVHLMRFNGAGTARTVTETEARTAALDLIRLGRAATVALQREAPPPFDGPGLWLRLRPRRHTDLRKLLAAVFLIAPGM